MKICTDFLKRRQNNKEPKVCSYFNGWPGSCKFGDECSMLHVQPGQKNSRQRASDQLTPSGRSNTGTTKNQHDRNRGNKNQRRGGGSSMSNRDKLNPVLPTLVNIIKPEKKGFRAIPIIPTEREILAPQPEEGDILVNRIDEGYDSIDEYLETHYKLLREDCIRSLREGIQLLKSQSEEQIRDLRSYAKVNLVGVTFASIGVVHRISFRTRDFERVNWYFISTFFRT